MKVGSTVTKSPAGMCYIIISLFAPYFCFFIASIAVYEYKCCCISCYLLKLFQKSVFSSFLKENCRNKKTFPQFSLFPWKKGFNVPISHFSIQKSFGLTFHACFFPGKKYFYSFEIEYNKTAFIEKVTFHLLCMSIYTVFTLVHWYNVPHCV